MYRDISQWTFSEGVRSLLGLKLIAKKDRYKSGDSRASCSSFACLPLNAPNASGDVVNQWNKTALACTRDSLWSQSSVGRTGTPNNDLQNWRINNGRDFPADRRLSSRLHQRKHHGPDRRKPLPCVN